MGIEEVLKKLAEYKKYEGSIVSYKGNSPRTIKKVIAAPSQLAEFTANYQAYVENSAATVELGLSTDYDIYFYENPYAPIALFMRLDDFLENCKVLT